MRYAIVSDLHANAQAWNAVLTDLGSYHVDRILCLGDVVGYGPDPVKVLESVHRHVHAFVLGNHDAVVCGKMTPETFNDRAQQVILWTQSQLGKSARDFLGTVPLTLTGPGFRCTHGSFANPAAFDYVMEAEDAPASWDAVPEPLLFVGHSHTPAIFVRGRSGAPHRLAPQDFSLEPEKRYIVNVGSVGSPRDGDARACYVIYDADAGTILFRRIPFDLDVFRESVLRAGLDPEDLPSLRRDPRRRLASVREDLDFAPATRPEEEARNVAEVGEVENVLRRRVSRWKTAAAAAVLLAVAGSVGAFAFARSGRPEFLAVPAEAAASVGTDAWSSVAGGFLPDLPSIVGNDRGIRPWRIIYGNAREQTLAVLNADAERHPTRILLHSTNAQHPLRIEAPSVKLGEDDLRLVVYGEGRRGVDFEGHVGIVVDILRETADGTLEWVPNYEAVEFRLGRTATAPETAQKTRDFPKSTREVRIALRGTFRGEYELHTLRLTRPAARGANAARRDDGE